MDMTVLDIFAGSIICAAASPKLESSHLSNQAYYILHLEEKTRLTLWPCYKLTNGMDTATVLSNGKDKVTRLAHV